MIVFKQAYCCLDGKFVAATEAKVSVFDHGFWYGDGVFESVITSHFVVML